MSHEVYGKLPSTLGKAALTELPSGALMWYVMVHPDGRDDVPEIRGSICLVKKDGELMQKNVANLAAILGGQWDPKDLIALEGIDPTGIAVLAEYVDTEPKERKDGNGTVTFTEVKNIWPANGGGGGLGLPEQGDAKKLAAKFGAKFRAAAAATPKPAGAAKPPAAKPPPAPSAPKPPAAPSPKGPVSNMNECWDGFYQKLNAVGKSDNDINKAWRAKITAFGGDMNAMTPAQWGAFKAEIDAMSDGDPTPF